MILTQRNDRLYDSRNFDNYQNYYAIRYDVEKYHFIKDKNTNNLLTVYTQYINFNLILSVNTNKESSDNNIYQILYGHFYNDQNVFLFKKVHNGKIAGYKINKCQRTELWHNNLNQLYISNYFGEVKKTAVLLNNEAYKDIDSTIINPILTYINYKDETLSFIELWNSTYENEILTMDVNNPYIIK